MQIFPRVLELSRVCRKASSFCTWLTDNQFLVARASVLHAVEHVMYSFGMINVPILTVTLESALEGLLKMVFSEKWLCMLHCDFEIGWTYSERAKDSSTEK
jgi:hypothetical protein